MMTTSCIEVSLRYRDSHLVAAREQGHTAQTLRRAHGILPLVIDGGSVKDYADEVGISSSNAGVRIFRAREALRKQVARSCETCAAHGCVDCTCDQGATHGHRGESTLRSR
jgi:hypothetical protein